MKAKAALGRRAARLIEPGQTVIFDGGTTNLEIVRHLAPGLHFVAITHSPAIAMELEGHGNVEVLLIGGKLFRHSMVAVGALAVEMISRIRADLFFLGVTGVHREEGLTTADMEEAAVKRAIIGRSSEIVVLATGEKLGAVSPYLVARIDEIDTLIVEEDAPEPAIVEFEEAGVAVVRA